MICDLTLFNNSLKINTKFVLFVERKEREKGIFCLYRLLPSLCYFPVLLGEREIRNK